MTDNIIELNRKVLVNKFKSSNFDTKQFDSVVGENYGMAKLTKRSKVKSFNMVYD